MWCQCGLNYQDYHLIIRGEQSLYKIVGQVGRVIKMDSSANSKERLNLARVMIKVRWQEQLQDYIKFYNKHAMIVEHKLEYERRPIRCSKCNGFVHETDVCRKNEGMRI